MGLLQAPAAADLAVVAAGPALRRERLDQLRHRRSPDPGGDGPDVAAAGPPARTPPRDPGAAGDAVHHLLQRAALLLQPQRRADVLRDGQCGPVLAGAQQPAVALVGRTGRCARPGAAGEIPGRGHDGLGVRLLAVAARLARSAATAWLVAGVADRAGDVHAALVVAERARFRALPLCQRDVAGAAPRRGAALDRSPALAGRSGGEPCAARLGAVGRRPVRSAAQCQAARRSGKSSGKGVGTGRRRRPAATRRQPRAAVVLGADAAAVHAAGGGGRRG